MLEPYAFDVCFTKRIDARTARGVISGLSHTSVKYIEPFRLLLFVFRGNTTSE